MGIIDVVSSLGPDTGDGAATEQSDGAYWCDDCDVRVRDVDVDDEGLTLADDGTPTCPDCGDAMRFERSHADDCAC